MNNEETLLAFKRLNEEVEDLRRTLKTKDETILNLQQTILKLNQELMIAKQSVGIDIRKTEKVTEASRSFL